MKKLIILFVFLFWGGYLYARTTYQDSLYNLLIGNIPDSSRAAVLNQIAASYFGINDYVAIKEAKRALEFARKSSHRYYEAVSLYNIGYSYGNVNRFSEAQQYLFKALKIGEEIKDVNLILRIYNQIGIIYSYNKNAKQALKYFGLFLEEAKKSGNKGYIAKGYNNLGISLKNQKKYNEALDYYKKALAIFRESGFERGILSSYANIGVALVEMKQYDSGMVYHEKAFELAKKSNDTFSLAITYINRGELLFYLGRYAEAIKLYKTAVDISVKTGLIQQYRDAAEGLYKCYEKLGDYKNALISQKLYLQLRDSIFNNETNTKLTLAESNYEQLKLEQEMEKKEQQNKIDKAEKDKQIAQEKAANEETKKYVWVMIIVTISIIALVIIVYWRYKEKNKANILLKKQKDEIEQSKKEITDSINYALRIQKAVLPDVSVLKKYFSDEFILYMPKDIVSGDFYWFNESNGHFILAAADCTGHGVPGGFMSMIGTDKLNHAVFEKGETDPGKILSLLSNGVKNALKQGDNENSTRDGMDISLLSFPLINPAGAEKRVVFWSGANRPLWHFSSGKFTEYKPTKSAIGGFTAEETVFEKMDVTVKKGDRFYLFSDGFADQFGGSAEKKLTTRKFREKLMEVQALPMENQKKELLSLFQDWKGNGEQIDDVLVIGIEL